MTEAKKQAATVGGDDKQLIEVEVVYALPHRQLLKSLKVKPGCTALNAAISAGMEEEFDGLQLTSARMGIFSELLPKPAEYILQPGDRVEIYRPLVIDPKEARRIRAEKARADRQRQKEQQPGEGSQPAPKTEQ